jgi:hypothetical protein
MSDIETLTVDELIAHLTKFPHDTKVFISSDTEGNGFGSISASFDDMRDDKAIIIYPAQERLEIDEICPKWWEAQE